MADPHTPLDLLHLLNAGDGDLHRPDADPTDWLSPGWSETGGADLLEALELGWSSIDPALAKSLTPPGDVAHSGDLSAVLGELFSLRSAASPDQWLPVLEPTSPQSDLDDFGAESGADTMRFGEDEPGVLDAGSVLWSHAVEGPDLQSGLEDDSFRHVHDAQGRFSALAEATEVHDTDLVDDIGEVHGGS